MIKKISVVALLSVLITSVQTGAFAQTSPIVSHVALYIKDLKKSADFYRDVMLFKEIPEPFHDGKHVWLRTGEHSQLHLIEGAAEITEHDINSHFAYSVPNLAEFMKHLDALNVNYGDWNHTPKLVKARPDGVKQIYLHDPDNIWIEVNDDKF